mmetsp:Transcript_29041/g.39890  ORF Transcript_29041/g.39890 Transcript_29041/m.39890 type:complete len:325 (+) Transcript_29041:1-975(+)
MQNTISSTMNTTSTASRRPKKAVLVGSLGDHLDDGDVQQGVEVGERGGMEVLRGDSQPDEMEEKDSKKRRKFQLNSKRKTTSTLSFETGHDDNEKIEVNIEEIYNPPKKTATTHINAAESVVLMHKPEVHPIIQQQQQQLNESESDRFLAAIFQGTQNTILHQTSQPHVANIPLPSFFTTTPPSPPTDKRSKPPQRHSTSNASTSLNNSHRSQRAPTHYMARESSQRAVMTEPSVLPPSPQKSESDLEFDGISGSRNKNKSSFESVSQRLKAELSQSNINNSSSMKKKHKKKDKDRKKEKDKRKKSSKKGRIRDEGTSSSSESD